MVKHLVNLFLTNPADYEVTVKIFVREINEGWLQFKFEELMQPNSQLQISPSLMPLPPSTQVQIVADPPAPIEIRGRLITTENGPHGPHTGGIDICAVTLDNEGICRDLLRSFAQGQQGGLSRLDYIESQNSLMQDQTREMIQREKLKESQINPRVLGLKKTLEEETSD